MIIECPYCGVYWNTTLPNVIIPNNEAQADCIKHVAQDHSTQLLIEMLSNELEGLRKCIVHG